MNKEESFKAIFMGSIRFSLFAQNGQKIIIFISCGIRYCTTRTDKICPTKTQFQIMRFLEHRIMFEHCFTKEVAPSVYSFETVLTLANKLSGYWEDPSLACKY
jgi:hypothetical protein